MKSDKNTQRKKFVSLTIKMKLSFSQICDLMFTYGWHESFTLISFWHANENEKLRKKVMGCAEQIALTWVSIILLYVEYADTFLI